MKAEDEIFFIERDSGAFKLRTQIVHPTEAAALAAALKPRLVRQSAPPSFAMLGDVVAQNLVFLRPPRSLLLHHHLLALYYVDGWSWMVYIISVDTDHTTFLPIASSFLDIYYTPHYT